MLRDGAAAQYGSDAIAGVINIQLKNASHGGRASVTWGEYITTINDVAKVTGLQTQSAPASRSSIRRRPRRYFLANTDGERHVQRRGPDHRRRQSRASARAARFHQPVSGEYHIATTINRAGFDLRPNFILGSAVDDASIRAKLSFNRLRIPVRRSAIRATIISSSTAATTSRRTGSSTRFGSYGHRNATSAANWRQ